MRITEVKLECYCGWKGTVGDATPDFDGDGNLGCPSCGDLLQADERHR